MKATFFEERNAPPSTTPIECRINNQLRTRPTRMVEIARFVGIARFANTAAIGNFFWLLCFLLWSVQGRAQSAGTAHPGDGKPAMTVQRLSGFDTLHLLTLDGVLGNLHDRDSLSLADGLALIFAKKAAEYPEEKIHLQLDRDRYFAGDTIWFSSYFFVNGIPGTFSQMLHVDLFKDSALIESKLFPVDSAGQLELPENLEAGTYTLQAYTPWMLNFDHALFYHCNVTLYRPRVALSDHASKRGIAHARMLAGKPGEAGAYDFQDKPTIAGAQGFQGGTTKTGAQSFQGGATNGGAGGLQAETKTGAQHFQDGSVKTIARNFDIQFLPEGGASVQNLPSVVAFAAVDNLGHPLEVEGWIGDEGRDTAASFLSVHDGMGTFRYVPRTGSIYYAHVRSGLGERTIPLPVARPDGVTLHAEPTAQGVRLTLRAGSNTRYFGHSLALVGTMYGQPAYEATVRFTKDLEVFSGLVPMKDLSNGMLRLSLIDEDSLPIAERVVFVRPKPLTLTPSLSFHNLNTGPRGLNDWQLSFSDSVHGNLSISVTDADALNSPIAEQDIFSDLLLTEEQAPAARKELRGKIFNPAWYFRDEADSTRQALDLVMLTHGWRSFAWQDLRNPHFFPPLYYTPNTPYEVGGRVFVAWGKKAIRSKDLNFVIDCPGAITSVQSAPIGSNGRFRLKNLVFFDTATAYFQVNEEGDNARNIRIELDPPPLPPANDFIPSGRDDRDPLSTDTIFQTVADKKAAADIAVHRFLHAKELKEIRIQGVSKERMQMQEMDDRYTFGMFSGGDGYSFDLIHHPELTNCSNVFDMLGGRVPGLTIKGEAPKFSCTFRGQGSPALYLDEMPTTEEVLNNLQMNTIAYVKFIPPPFMGAYLGGANGAIAVYLKRGADLFADDRTLNHIRLQGYSVTRRFYSPIYDEDPGLLPSSAPDYRLTLNWQPALFLNDSTRDARILFYNNDHCRRFRIVAEGMDASGRLLHFERVISGDNK